MFWGFSVWFEREFSFKRENCSGFSAARQQIGCDSCPKRSGENVAIADEINVVNYRDSYKLLESIICMYHMKKKNVQRKSFLFFP